MSTKRLSEAFECVDDFLQEVESCKEEKPMSLERCIAHGLPTALLSIANIASEVKSEGIEVQDAFFKRAQPLIEMLNLYDPNPGKTTGSLNEILSNFPSIA